MHLRANADCDEPITGLSRSDCSRECCIVSVHVKRPAAPQDVHIAEMSAVNMPTEQSLQTISYASLIAVQRQDRDMLW